MYIETAYIWFKTCKENQLLLVLVLVCVCVCVCVCVRWGFKEIYKSKKIFLCESRFVSTMHWWFYLPYMLEKLRRVWKRKTTKCSIDVRTIVSGRIFLHESQQNGWYMESLTLSRRKDGGILITWYEKIMPSMTSIHKRRIILGKTSRGRQLQ